MHPSSTCCLLFRFTVMGKEEFVAELPAVSCLITINVSKVRTITGSIYEFGFSKRLIFPKLKKVQISVCPEENIEKFSEI